MQRFAVFGLGSRAYPDTFCAFAHTINKLFGDLGGDQIFPLGEGDELCGQAETFRHWAMKCYEVSFNNIIIHCEVNALSYSQLVALIDSQNMMILRSLGVFVSNVN